MAVAVVVVVVVVTVAVLQDSKEKVGGIGGRNLCSGKKCGCVGEGSVDETDLIQPKNFVTFQIRVQVPIVVLGCFVQTKYFASWCIWLGRCNICDQKCQMSI